jgi:hypothetical protein
LCCLSEMLIVILFIVHQLYYKLMRYVKGKYHFFSGLTLKKMRVVSSPRCWCGSFHDANFSKFNENFSFSIFVCLCLTNTRHKACSSMLLLKIALPACHCYAVAVGRPSPTHMIWFIR